MNARDPGNPRAAVTPPRAIGLVADDLTGATDSLAPFARWGWSVHFQLESAAIETFDGPGTVVALTTDARARPDDEAFALTAAAVHSLAGAGADRIFLKVDSTMRGSVAAQIRGALASWHPHAFAVLCPAYPQLGRTVDANVVRVHGELLEASASSTDPVTPVRSSSLASLVPGSARVGMPAAQDRNVDDFARTLADAADAARVGDTAVVAVDAGTTADLDFLAEAIGRLGARAIPVGSAGLSEALARVWRGERGAAFGASRESGRPSPEGPDPSVTTADAGRVLVVVSSLHGVARGQAAALENLGAGLRDRVAVVITPHARSDLLPSGEIAESLALIVADHLSTGTVTALVLVGGDGARATLRRLGASAVRITGLLADGVPSGTVVGGSADGLRVVTKSGGFGGRNVLVEIVHTLMGIVPDPEAPAAHPPGQDGQAADQQNSTTRKGIRHD